MKKMDNLLHNNDKSSVFERTTHSNVLQESSNLLSITSDSLPDIFRKPIIQQQPDVALSLQSKTVNFEDKVSKWGYGPSSNNTQSGAAINKPQYSEPRREIFSKVEENFILKTVKEETPTALSKFSYPQLNSTDGLEKLSNLSSQSPPVRYELEESASNKCQDKTDFVNSTTSETTSSLRVPTQPTIKIHPLDFPQTPLAKKLTFTGHSVTANEAQKPPLLTSSSSKTEIVNDAPISSNTCIPPSKLELLPFRTTEVVVSKLGQSEPIKPILIPAEVASLNQGREEPQNKIAAPVSKNFLPPPNSRPPTKSKQISVNGKVFTVMKPLGRGGSSVVYQVGIVSSINL